MCGGGGGKPKTPKSCAVQKCPYESLHTQEKSNSCVIASSRNMINRLKGKDIKEKTLRDEMRKIMKKPDHDFDKNGINPNHAVTLLKNNGIDAETKKGVKPEDLDDLVKPNKPVMIGFKKPGHRVILDGVGTDKEGNTVYYVSYPASSHKGKPRVMTESEFEKRYNDKAIVIIPK